MAQEYPYTPVPAKMEELLNTLPSLGIPEKANQEWLKGLGYTSSNDRQTLAAMRRLGMVGGNSQPTDYYRAVRSQNRAKVAEGVKAAYRELFELYPDAHRKDAEALQSFFRSKTSSGDSVQRFMVRTFQLICKYGDFDEAPESTTVPTPKEQTEASSNGPAADERRSIPGGGLTLNVNIQLQLPPSAEGEVYDKLFEAMGTHLKGLANLE